MIKPFLFSRKLAGMVLLGLSLLISACGGSGGGGGSSFVDVVASSFSGSVGDGPIVQGTVKIYDRKGQLLQTEVSDVYASYTTSLEAEEDAYPLILEVTDGTDLVTNREPDFTLISVVLDPSVTQVNINPYTMIIVEVARNMPGGITAENISAARLIIMEKLNFGLDPAYVADPLGTRITDQNVAVMVKASEALGEMIRRTRDQLATTANDVVVALAHDMVDGELDGRGGSKASNKVAAVSLLTSAQVLIEALSNNLEVDGEVATGSMDDSIVATRPSVPLSSLTNSVPINQEQLEQARDTIKVAQALSPSVELDAIATTLDSLSAGSMVSAVEAVLPIGTSDALDQPVAIAVAANDEDLDTAINVSSTDVPTDTPTNRAPVLSGTPSTSATEDIFYSFTPGKSDPDGDTLSFSINLKPSWASFSPSTGKLSGTPRNGDVGANGIVISVTDGAKTVSLPSFNITVQNTNDAPTIGGTPPTSATEDIFYSFTPIADDPDGDTLSFSYNTKPSWASFSPSTGKLSGTPRNGDVGANGIVISVTDGTETVSLPSFNITVQNINDAPTIGGTPPTSATEDGFYSFTPIADDPDGDTLSFSYNTKPSWASFSPSTGKLSGTPRNGDVGANGIVISVTDGAETVSLPSFNITVQNINDAPTIGGTPPTSATEDIFYSFTPIADDPDGDTLSFSYNTKPSWASFSPSTGKLSGTPRNGDVGANGIVISVTDGAETVSLPSFNITVKNTNDAPTIGGTPPTSATEDIFYSFTPIADDPDGDTLSFSYNTKPSWASFSPSTGKLSGTPRNGDVGANGIVISVTDGTETVSLPSFNITVQNINDAPTIGGTPPTSATEDGFYSFTPIADDPDGDTLSFSYNTKPSWASFSPSTGKLSGTPRNGDVGANGIVISVTDGAETVSLPSFNITVQNINDAPTIGGTPPTSATEDIFYSFTPIADDPDGDTLSFSYNTKPSWASFSPSTGKLSGTPRNGDVGANGIVISVTDGAETVSLPSFNITVKNTNDAPTIGGTPPTSATEDIFYSFTPIADDPDGDTLSFSYNTKPSWASFSPSTGKLSGTPRNGDVGANGIVISVTDGAETVSLPSFNITVQNTNDAPTIGGTPPTSATEDIFYSFTPIADDPDGDTLSFSYNTKPSWASFSPSTGKLSGTPRNGDVGANGIVISVTDGAETVSLPSFNITVKNTNDAPTIGGTPPTSATEDIFYSFTPIADDPDGDTLSFSYNTKPSWASFSPSTGKLSGTPRNGDVGANGIVISVTDGAETVSLPSFNITVQNINDAPTIGGTPPTSATEDIFYSFTPIADDPDGDTLSFSYNTKPSWASFSPSTGKLSGTPRNGDVGANGIVISVTDGAETVSLPSFNITVQNINDAPTIGGTPPTSATEDIFYSFTPIADDPDGDTLSFSYNTKPSWASFSPSTGKLSGTPRNGDVGANGIVISVTDGTETVSLPSFNITVQNINDAPTIGGTPPTSATEDIFYSFTPIADDPDGDTLSFSYNTKPSWASFSPSTGKLSGTPRNGDVGANGIVISVTDGTETVSLPSFNITVQNINDAPTIGGTPPTSATEDIFYSFTPIADDPDGDTLSFSYNTKPSWASFSPSTGKLSGTPRNGDVGANGIVISVTDGAKTASLPAFSITVDAAGSQTGSFNVSWTAPVARADGAAFALAEIGGYRIYFGESSGTYTDVADVTDVTATSWSVTNVPVGTSYVVMTTLDVDGRESGYSQEISKPIQ